jgi:hypothetical protein
VFGPHERKDLADCEYYVKHKMVSKAKLKQLFPDVADKIEADYDTFLQTPEAHKNFETDQYGMSPNRAPAVVGTTKTVDIARKEIRIVECWRKVYLRSFVIAQPDDEFFFNAFGWQKADIDQARTLPGVRVVEQSVPKIRITKIAGGVLLSDENPADLPSDEFYVVPMYAYKRKNKYWGKVKDLIDPQQEMNKRHSQTIDIGNKMVSYGWFYDSMTFPEGEKEKFKQNSAKPGFLAEVQDVTRLPAKVEGVKFPSELVQLYEMSDAQLLKIANITPEPGGANESGAAILQKIKTRLTANQFLFDNLSFAKLKVGRLLIKLIQRYYTPDRILRILQSENSRNPVELGGQQMDTYSQEEILGWLNNADLDKYDVVVSEASWSPSQRIATYVLMKDLASAGVQLPPDIVIEMSELPEAQKKKFIESIQQQAAAQSQGQSDTAQAEIDKTLIAKGIIPPKIQEEYGIDATGAPVQQPAPLGGVGEGQPVGYEAAPPQEEIPQEMPPAEGQPAPEAPAPAAPQEPSSNELLKRMLVMQMRSIESLAQAIKQPKRQVGHIVRDENGNAQVVVQSAPQNLESFTQE